MTDVKALMRMLGWSGGTGSDDTFLSSLINNPHGWGPTGPAVDPSLQYDRQGDETWRGLMTPLRTVKGKLGQGDSLEFATPHVVSDMLSAVMAPGKAYFEGMSPEEINSSAASAAGLAMTGGLAAPAMREAENALMSGWRWPWSKSLDMSKEARLARAREMGFDTDTIYYHGTSSNFDRFDPALSGKNYGDHPEDGLGPKFYFGTDKHTAQKHADFDAYRQQRIFGNPDASPRVIAAYLRNAEHLNGPLTRGEHIVRNPSDIRSIDAAFDPAQSDSSFLLAANGSKQGAGVGALAAAIRKRMEAEQ